MAVPAAISFPDYLASLGRLTAHIDPTNSTPDAEAIRQSFRSLRELPAITAETITAWVLANPKDTYVLALAAGLSREKFKNQLKDWFGTSSWNKAAVDTPAALVSKLDQETDLIRLLCTQIHESYDFGDILVARAGTRVTATSAGRSGRKIEDELERIADDLGLPYELRTRFEGRSGKTAPADIAIPSGGRGCIVAVAAKGFDSTGSKLTDAVREIEEMADARTGNQITMAVVDGIGWKSRQADLKRIWNLWDSQEIDGLYTLATLDIFREDLTRIADLRQIPRR
ncbi:hypothetical protein GCM10027030_23840 [Luteococcus sediminum]